MYFVREVAQGTLYAFRIPLGIPVEAGDVGVSDGLLNEMDAAVV